MSTASLGPLAVNTSSPQPWDVPLRALESLWYPPVADSYPQSLVVLGAIFLIEFGLAVAALWVRVRRGDVRLYRVQAGLLFPSTAILWLIFIGCTCIILETQTWLTWRQVQDHGSYHGLFLLRGLAWTFGHLFIYIQLVGLALSTSFSSCPTRAGGLVRAERTIWLNAAILGFPVLLILAIMVPAIVGEATCGQQYESFRSVQSVGLAAQQTWANGNGLSQDTVTAWYGGLERMQSSHCEAIEHGLFGEFFVWVSLEIIGTVFCYVALSRKLQAQIDILKNSVHTFHELERKSVLPGRDVDAFRKSNAGLDLVPTKSLPYEAFGQEVEIVPSRQFAPESEREREIERHRLHERRAQGLKHGLNQLRWLSGLTLVATVCYLALVILTLQLGVKVETSGYWSTVESMLGLWTFAVIGGLGITILLISGLDPDRQSFLGISLHSAKREDLESFAASLPDAPAGTLPALNVPGAGGSAPSLAGRSQESGWTGFRDGSPAPPAMAELGYASYRESQFPPKR